MDLVIRDRLALDCAVPGPVYGTLLNFRDALAALGDAVTRPPYKAPPVAPILYLKPPNTYAAHGAAIVVPRGVDALAMGGTLGVVVGRVACRVREHDALSYVAGYTVANDVSIPHGDYHRPSVRFTCRDGFCALGPWVVAARHVADPGDLTLRITIDGVERLRASTRDLVRPVREAAGRRHGVHDAGAGRRAARRRSRAPAARARGPERRGDHRRRRHARKFAGAAMRRARVAYGGAIHEAYPEGARLRLADGRVVGETDVVWLPPCEPSTIVALGLNYADHAKELRFGAQSEPLVFLKGPGALIGHRGQTRRPADATFMHYECELAVVIAAPPATSRAPTPRA